MRVIVAGGGTGGHLFPGIAFAVGMQRRVEGCRILFIGTPRQLDRKTLAGYDFELDSIECMGLKGMGMRHRLQSIMQLPSAMLEARRKLKKFSPDLVFGVGGYVTGPVLLAARLGGYPVCIHEQNSVPGMANKILSRIAHRIFISIPCGYPFAQKKTVLTGNPVRQEIVEASAADRDKEAGRFTLLVLGGSQGAHRVNMLVLDAVERLAEFCGSRLKVIHQTGKKDAGEVHSRYLEIGVDAAVKDFIQDMAGIYRQADLVISRAGATTLAELAVMGLPALLIPYPYAADNHQQTNALYYEEGGGAVTLPEDELSGEKLAEEVLALFNNPERVQSMGGSMKKMARPDATARIIDECLTLVHGPGIPATT
jgi:UDP-N-acetylglucosamine--N-acetylmuramyl-(pentapeptide) pyrophosphoryl-undecaprenol N-acetylglucosamine transferase